jgi:hypothetical protein
LQRPAYLAIVARYATSLIGDGVVIALPKVRDHLDHEGELQRSFPSATIGSRAASRVKRRTGRARHFAAMEAVQGRSMGRLFDDGDLPRRDPGKAFVGRDKWSVGGNFPIETGECGCHACLSGYRG